MSHQHNQQQSMLPPSSAMEPFNQSNGLSMSQTSQSLFACTKCNARHRFEELSRRHQLCRACKASFKVIKCDYCSGEFKLEEVTDVKSTICTKCLQLQEQHGKPNICSFCDMRAAFIGSKCQRCNNSEKKYGPPLSCESCSKKCAFERPDPDSRAKVGGKLLCWSCTMNYKRSQAKEKYRLDKNKLKSSSSQSNRHHSSSSSNMKNSSMSGDISQDTKQSSHHRHRHDNQDHHRRRSPSTSNGTLSNGKNSTSHRSHQHSHNNNNHSNNNNNNTNASNGNSNNNNNTSNPNGANHGHHSSSEHNNHHSKKPRTENRSSHNQLDNHSKLHISSFADTNGATNDLTSTIGQLKDEIASLNKRLNQKERDLFMKDQQIADLKSTMAREQKELREKINTLQKQHTEKMSEMQYRLVAMQKQLASQVKASRANNDNNTATAAYIEPPMVI